MHVQGTLHKLQEILRLFNSGPKFGIPWPCYRGHLGPLGPKLEKESENEFPGPRGPRTHFPTLFRTLGPEGPNDPSSRQTFSQPEISKKSQRSPPALGSLKAGKKHGETKLSTSAIAALSSKMALTGQKIVMVDMGSASLSSIAISTVWGGWSQSFSLKILSSCCRGGGGRYFQLPEEKAI